MRLGRDKCRIDLGGRDFVARSVDLLSGLCPETWVVGRNASVHGLNVPWTLDDYPDRGPLGGILTALNRAEGRPCLVLACDLPFMDQGTLRTLVQARGHKRPHAVLTTFEQSETGYIESLAAVYEPEAKKFLLAGIEQGRHKLSRLIPADYRHPVYYSRQQSLPFFNVNYPCDLALLENFRETVISRDKSGVFSLVGEAAS